MNNNCIEEYREYLKGKKILVVGLGRSGKAAITAMHELGAVPVAQDSSAAEKVDQQFLKYLENENIEKFLACVPENITDFDMIVLSPGVATDLDWICDAREKGVEILGELELAYRITKGRFVGITGTNGKTTTTTLVGDIFKAAERKSSVVGNIGNAVIAEAIASTEDSWHIAEVSSFQLETTSEFEPVVSAILNLTPDHLNRHKTMEAYAAAKAKVYANQTADEYLIVNADDELTMALCADCKARIIPFSRKKELELGAFLLDDMLVIKDEAGITHVLCGVSDLKIIGDHNIENALAAAAIAFFAGIDSEIIGETIKNFPGVEHRIEYAGRVDGVDYYNDSKGTNVSASIIAMNALKENILMIAGGDGKAQDFTEFAEALGGRVKALILFGRDAGIIEEAARKAGYDSIYLEKDMNGCVERAKSVAEAGDKVLLSPACASWDMYSSYEQRGKHFKTCVEQLLK